MSNPAGCTGISDPVFAEACVSNTVNLSGQLSLLLFPNPARDKVTLELQSPMDLSEVRLELYGFDGRWVGLFSKANCCLAIPPWNLVCPNYLQAYTSID